MAHKLRTWMTALFLCGAWVVTMCSAAESGEDWADLDLAEEHIPYFFHNNPGIRKKCVADPSCPYKREVKLSKIRCWGYEDDCDVEPLLPHCPDHHRQWANGKEAQRAQFWRTADFGYVQNRRKELQYYCKQGDSSLRCVDHLLYCEAKNLYIDLSTARIAASRDPYREDIIGPGQIGGHCELRKGLLQAQLDHKSPLQSWAAELEHYTSLPFHPITDQKCDVVISEPVYLIKLDATVNMYHHFCDYVNLYVSQHVNNSFSKHVKIILWNTSGAELSPMFVETWQAFSNTSPLLLKNFDGKKICIKDAVFSLLARMRQGLYYNMPLMPGCYGSSMIKAFSHHLAHRLRIPQYGPLRNKIRVTILARSTKYRQILNQEELLNALKTDPQFEVRKVDFKISMPFPEQFEISHNSDILIGMHGAGLTHMLFQPDWAVIFELYNCEDVNCYYDLARLRGIKYMTWENKAKLIQEDEGHHPTLGAHAKFTNYAFDVQEFMRLVQKAADHVRQHPKFISELELKLFTDENGEESQESQNSQKDIQQQEKDIQQQKKDSPQQKKDSPQQKKDSPQQKKDSPQQKKDSPQQVHHTEL